ncbi:MAG: divergent polysaccharide deacetylase family protein [Silicimonas sp.]
MGRGFLAGIFWGGVVGVSLLLVSSQTMERQQLSFPKPEASPVEVPGGSEFDQSRVDTDPVLPGIEETPGADEIVTGVLPPEDAVETPPAFDTSSLDIPQPSVEGPAGLGDAPEVADEVTVPEGSDAGRVGSADNLAGVPSSPSLEAPETPVAAPEADTAAPTPGEAPDTEGLEVVEAGPDDAAPEAEAEIAALPDDSGDALPSVAESAPAIQPDTDGPASPVSPGISEAPSMPGVRVPEAGEAPAETEMAAQPQPAAPEIPAATPAEPEAPAEPELAETEAAPAEDVEEDMAETEPAPVPGPAPDVAQVPDSGGVATVDGGDSQFFTPVETFQDRAEGVGVNRLPTIGSDEDNLPVVRRLPGTPLSEDEPEAADEEVAEEPAAMDGPAIRAFAMDYDTPANAALISVILMHEGPEPMAAADLGRLPPTVAFAIDAGAPNAAGVASEYRRAGREVVMIPSLPAGATPQDVEVALSANLTRIPEAVAIMDVTGSSFQSDREAVAQVVAVVTDTGHGLITFPRGLNTAHQQAERAGLPTGLIFRVVDEDGESDEQIRRTLDRAAFRARQDDAVILVGHTRPGTMAAIKAWAEEAAANVTLAPVSAALSGR